MNKARHKQIHTGSENKGHIGGMETITQQDDSQFLRHVSSYGSDERN